MYEGAISSIGAKAKYISLDIPKNCESTKDIRLDLNKLESAITSKTALLILNTPHNPTGKVFSKTELESIGSILKNHPRVKVLSDEVYEHLTYEDCKHVSPRSVSLLKDKTICLYSAGKTFSITGWKIGWAIGPKELIEEMTSSQQWVVFSVATPLQHAVSELLIEAEKPYKSFSNFYSFLKASYSTKREGLLNGLVELGFSPIKPEGSFFIVASSPKKELYEKIDDYEQFTADNKILIDKETLDYNSYNLARNLSISKKVTTIPMAAFYEDSKKREVDTVRFAFCKTEADLEKAIERLK